MSTKKTTNFKAFYTLARILLKNCLINIIYGERSNGKTTAVLLHIVEQYVEKGKKGVIVRWTDVEIKASRADSMFAGAVAAGLISKATDGEWNDVYHRAGKFYFKYYDPDTLETKRSPEYFCRIAAVSTAVNDKSVAFPNTTTIMFDEFMRTDRRNTEQGVLDFLNLVSTIVRQNAEAKVFLIANSLSYNDIFFEKFRIAHKIRTLEIGKIAHIKYKHPDKGITMSVAAEYCASSDEVGGKDSDAYFLIDDPRAAMIIDGSYALPIYPKCPKEFTKDDVKLTYWIGEMRLPDETVDPPEPFDGMVHGIIRGRLIKVDSWVFIFFDRVPPEKFEYLYDEKRDITYTLKHTGERNNFPDPVRAYDDKRTVLMARYLAANRTFFSNSYVGEDLMYYIASTPENRILRYGR